MTSINAQTVANKVYQKVLSGKKVVLGEIIKESGYSESISLHPIHVTRTKSYKMALERASKPLQDRLMREINEIELAMSKKDKNKEEYRVLAGVLDLSIKNYQLLSGGATERQVFVLPSEVMIRNKIETTGEQGRGVDKILPIDLPKEG